MSLTRRWLVGAVTALACAAAGAGAAGFHGIGPLASLAVTETRLEPQLAITNSPGDPLVVFVAVTWTKEGYCAEQFEVQAAETPTEVRVGTVVSRENRAMPCAGLGTVNNLAWVPLTLAAPPGSRTVLRSSDGSALPVRDRQGAARAR
ncbi:hypothetical protein [Actinoplanes sp. NPDC026623]|uniref:hypothetical protein n=1 Tax=Actinoplanes sp. NPDC026623 TaxID=3155610 RepID=UPI0033D000C5